MSAGNESPGIKITLAILAAAGAIAAGAFTFLSNKYNVDRPISATQTAEARVVTQAATALSLRPTDTPAPATAPPLPISPSATHTAIAPTDTPTPELEAHPFFTVDNRLGRPAIILVDDRRLGEAPAYGERDFYADSFPVTVEFRVRRPLDDEGAGLGAEVSGYWTDPADPDDRLILDNEIGESVYFYLILSNATADTCRVVVNRGSDDEVASAQPLPAGASDVEYGYHRLRPYSTVHIECGEDEWYWGQKNADDDGRPLPEQVEEETGELRLALEP